MGIVRSGIGRALATRLCVAVCVLAGACPSVAHADLFSPGVGSPFPAGSQPVALSLGDFNGDGNLDIAAANRDAGTLTELVGYGDGQFAPLAAAPVGNSPAGIAAGDFNGDGLTDLAVTDSGDNDVRVMLATPGGYLTLAPGSPILTGLMPGAIAAADLTGAGTPDLVVANYASGSVSVLLGDGTGGFSQAPGSPLAVNTPAALAIADFNQDGIPDLAVVDQFDNSVAVLLGTGTGDFSLAATVPVGASPIAIKAADFNADGIPDLAVLNRSDGTVSVLLGNGDGSFTPAPGSPISVGGDLSDLAVGDFDGDGRPDIAVADSQANTVSVLVGNGDGTFSAAAGAPESTGGNPDALAVGSFRGAGPDLAVANFADGTVSVLLNNALGAPPCDACDPPILGMTVNLAPVSGRVLVKLPRRRGGRRLPGTRFVPLRAQRQLPVGTIIDASHGVVRLGAASGRRGQIQTAQLSGTAFEVLQRRQDGGLTNLQLTSPGSATLCRAASDGATARTATLPSRVIALLHASAHGRFRTTSKYSAATVRGTQWDTIERCDGTLTRVLRGVVVVRDFRLRRNIIVRAGQSYFARR